MALKRSDFLMLLVCFMLFAGKANAQGSVEEQLPQYELTIDSNIQIFQYNELEKEFNKEEIDSNLNQSVWQKASEGLEYSEDPKKEKKEQKKINEKKTKKSFSYKGNAMRYLFLTLGILVLLLLVILIFKNSKFKRNTKVNIDYEVEELHPEEVSHNELDELLDKAIQSNNPRLSFRFSYLKLLKNLVEIRQIDYRKNKSNYDYLSEINHQEIKELFKEITIVFDYVWYGQKEYTMSEWEKSKEIFNQLNQFISYEKQ